MENGFLSYKQGNSIFHKCPAWIKIIFIPVLSISIFLLPFWFSLALIIIQFIVQLSLKFSFKDYYYDLRPVIFYAVLLYITKILSGGLNFNFKDEKETIVLLMKLLCMLQSASIMYKTSTPLQIREGFEKIECPVKKILKYKFSISEALSIFMIFIPMMSKIWSQSKKAWLIRGGKKNIRMFIVLLTMLFTVGLKKAWNNSRAIQIRS